MICHLVLLVVSAWTAGEDLQVSGKELTPSLLKCECIEDTQDFINYSTQLLRSLGHQNIPLESTCKLSVQLFIPRTLADTLSVEDEER